MPCESVMTVARSVVESDTDTVEPGSPVPESGTPAVAAGSIIVSTWGEAGGVTSGAAVGVWSSGVGEVGVRDSVPPASVGGGGGVGVAVVGGAAGLES